MIDSLVNLLFRCAHQRLTRPMAPVSKAGRPHSQSYVVCLDCGKQFEYDFEHMRIGKVIERNHEDGVIPPHSKSRKKKVALGLLAAAPAAILLGAAWNKRDKPTAPPDDAKTDRKP